MESYFHDELWSVKSIFLIIEWSNLNWVFSFYVLFWRFSLSSISSKWFEFSKPVVESLLHSTCYLVTEIKNSHFSALRVYNKINWLRKINTTVCFKSRNYTKHRQQSPVNSRRLVSQIQRKFVYLFILADFFSFAVLKTQGGQKIIKAFLLVGTQSLTTHYYTSLNCIFTWLCTCWFELCFFYCM